MKKTFAKAVLTVLIAAIITVVMIAMVTAEAKAAETATTETPVVKVITLDQRTLDRYSENAIFYYRLQETGLNQEQAEETTPEIAPASADNSASKAAPSQTDDTTMKTAPTKTTTSAPTKPVDMLMGKELTLKDPTVDPEVMQNNVEAGSLGASDGMEGLKHGDLMLSFYLTNADQQICEVIEPNMMYEAHLRIINTSGKVLNGLRASVRDLSAVIRGLNTTDEDVEAGVSAWKQNEVPVLYVGRIEGTSLGAHLDVRSAEGDLRIQTYDPDSIRLESGYFDGESDKVHAADLFSHWTGALIGDCDRDGTLRAGDEYATEVVFKVTTSDYIPHREPEKTEKSEPNTASVGPEEVTNSPVMNTVKEIMVVVCCLIGGIVIGVMLAGGIIFIYYLLKGRMKKHKDPNDCEID